MRLRWKLLTGYLLILFSALVLFQLWTESWVRNHYLADMEERLKSRLRMLAPLLDVNDPAIDAKIDRAGTPLTNRITLLDREGKVVADSAFSGSALQALENHLHREEVQQALQRPPFGSSLRYSTSVDEDLLYVAMQLPDQEGILRMATSLREVDRRLGGMRVAFAWRALLPAAVGCLLCVWVSWRWTRSIDRVEIAARELARGRPEVPLEISSRDDLAGLAASLKELAQRQRALEAEIVAERNYLHGVLSSVGEGILVVGGDGRIRYSNPAFSGIFNLSENPRGKLPLQLIRQPEIQAALETVLSEGAVVSEEIEVNGQRLEMHVSPISPPTEKGVAVAVFHDISELRRLEEVRRDFVSNMTHELRTPLTSIQGYSETLAQDCANLNEQQRGFVEKIARNSAQLAEIIQALLDLSRIERGNLSPRRELISVNDLCDELERSCLDKVKAKGLKWSRDTAGVTTFFASRPLLLRALDNLVDNAVKYTEQGEVGISLKKEGDAIRIDVVDTGVGIPEIEQSRVFERFYRGSRGRRPGRGSGIGLSIVKHIVALHGGRAWLESRVGKGTRVSFTLPREQAAAGGEAA